MWPFLIIFISIVDKSKAKLKDEKPKTIVWPKSFKKTHIYRKVKNKLLTKRL